MERLLVLLLTGMPSLHLTSELIVWSCLPKLFEYEDFDKFDIVRLPKIHYAGMLQHDGELKLPSYTLFPHQKSGELLENS